MAVWGAAWDAAIADLRSPDIKQRAAAEHALIAAGPEAVPSLAAAMRQARVRDRVAQVCVRIGRPAVPVLLDSLRDPGTRDGAGTLLFQTMPKDAPEFFTPLSECIRKPELKHYCGTALVKSMGPKVKGRVPKIVELLHNQDADIRAYAAAALGQIGPQASAAARDLIAALRDSENKVRWSAAAALGRMKVKSAVPELERAQSDPDGEVRRSAQEALRQIGAK